MKVLNSYEVGLFLLIGTRRKNKYSKIGYFSHLRHHLMRDVGRMCK